jgi:DNA-binding transcriptional MerR regulator
MNIKQAAQTAGISGRTLQHYDRIGLLTPGRNDENGYRDYKSADLDRLLQILFFKGCGFPLKSIGQLMNSPGFDRDNAYQLQRQALLFEKQRIDAMLRTLDKTMRANKGEITMSEKEKFEGFDFSQNPYEEEARRRWGNEAVDKSNERIKSMTKEEQSALARGMDELFARLAAVRLKDPSSDKAQEEVGRMYEYFNKNFGSYTYEAFEGLGRMYVEDSRFTKNIDKFGEGLSAFLSKAMSAYARAKAKEK